MKVRETKEKNKEKPEHPPIKKKKQLISFSKKKNIKQEKERKRLT
jgi:hypothetical protein